MYENIPNELKKLKQWVCWKAIPDEANPNKIKKVPINAATGAPAQSNNKDTWTSYKIAAQAAKKYTGLGFMFADGYFGVDIDGADEALQDYKNGKTDNIISEFIHTLQSYSETSHSGNGIHIICKGKLPEHGRRKGNVEMYSEGRYFVMTGNICAEYADINECTTTIKPLHEKYIGGGSEPSTGIILKEKPITLSENEVIDKAKKSKQGQAFTALFNGNWESFYTSQSEADMAFCNMLAFWTGKDESMMDSIFRKSGLMRDKWDRKQSGSTYGNMTISKAVRQCLKVYEPKAEYKVTVGNPDKPKTEKKLYTFDDTGNAERMFDTFGQDIRYNFISKSWMFWDKRKWTYDNSGAIKRMADDVIEEMKHDLDFYTENLPEGTDSEEMEKQFLKHVKQSRSSRSKTAMVKETEHKVPIKPDELDCAIMALNTPNGTINLKTGELLPHLRERHITKITNAEYTDKMASTVWDRFLMDIFDSDRELIRYLQKSIGYSLSGSTREDCVFFCYGSGRNGKTTFLDIISECLGDYATNIQPETLMVRQNTGGPTSDIARLKGARFVTCEEPSEGARLNEGLVKQLSGGGRVTASKKYENEFEFYPEFKVWMSTNHKPVVRGTDIGIWSRIRLIPFTVRIPDETIDKNLKHKLKKELPAILKWCIDGCLLWQREGLAIPEAVKNATKEYKNEMDVIGSFISSCCGEGFGQEGASDLFKKYLEWAEENNEYKMTSTRFGIEMAKRFNKSRDNAGRTVYQGLSLL